MLKCTIEQLKSKRDTTKITEWGLLNKCYPGKWFIAQSKYQMNKRIKYKKVVKYFKNNEIKEELVLDPGRKILLSIDVAE